MNIIYLIFSVVFITVALSRIVKRPEELAIVMLIVHSSFRVIVEGNAMAWGQKHANLRFEYILFFIALFLLSRYRFRPEMTHNSAIIRGAMLVFLIHLVSVPLSYYWQFKVGIGVTIRLLATFLYLVIIVHLTKREHLNKLVNAMMVVGALVAVVLLALVLTQNPTLYKLVNGKEMGERLATIDGHVFGANIGWFRYSFHALPVIGCMAFALFLLKSNKLWYGSVTLLILVQSIASGQRSPVIAMGFGLILVSLALPLFHQVQKDYFTSIFSMFAILLVAVMIFSVSESMSSRFDLFLLRAASTEEGLKTDNQLMGHQIAMDQLEEGGTLAWLFGYGGFKSTRTRGEFEFDINTPVVFILKYGLIGMLIISFYILMIAKKSLSLLQKVTLQPEELAILLSILIYILVWVANSFLRGSVFAENIRMLSWFVVWVAWMEVIDRDSRAERAAPAGHLIRTPGGAYDVLA